VEIEPQKLFVFLIDFFAILMPGAFLSYMLKDPFIEKILCRPHFPLEGAENWSVFLFVSYLLGHFVFLFGAQLDKVYDALAAATRDRQVERLAAGNALSPWPVRFLARVFFKKNTGIALRHAVLIKDRHLSIIGATNAVNAFQWSKSRLAMEQPIALATVQKFEADSKFFRSFVIVLVLAAVVAYNSNPLLALIGLPAMIFAAFWRYVDQRFKAIEQAYSFVITMEAEESLQKNIADFGTSILPDAPTHAGGVVFRRLKDRIEFLLVTATSRPSLWVLPKGHLEVGENAQHAAVREVREESGVWGKVLEPLQCSMYQVNGETVAVQFFLMEYLAQERPDERDRKSRWWAYESAVMETPFDEAKIVLGEANQIVAGLTPLPVVGSSG
jgi:ADP-ribose pyrophosphatase YjhB (NUDIX family)